MRLQVAAGLRGGFAGGTIIGDIALRVVAGFQAVILHLGLVSLAFFGLGRIEQILERLLLFFAWGSRGVPGLMHTDEAKVSGLFPVDVIFRSAFHAFP